MTQKAATIILYPQTFQNPAPPPLAVRRRASCCECIKVDVSGSKTSVPSAHRQHCCLAASQQVGKRAPTLRQQLQEKHPTEKQASQLTTIVSLERERENEREKESKPTANQTTTVIDRRVIFATTCNRATSSATGKCS